MVFGLGDAPRRRGLGHNFGWGGPNPEAAWESRVDQRGLAPRQVLGALNLFHPRTIGQQCGGLQKQPWARGTNNTALLNSRLKDETKTLIRTETAGDP